TEQATQRQAPVSAKPGELTLTVPEELLDTLAERVARLLAGRLAPPAPSSPWLDLEAALEYLPFTRDQLYKLTAARAIPFRKKREGQGLLFHRSELERWLETAYEPTGCSVEVELWSSTDT
ncbi:MAG: helix-turn-helix domain-containing protein, partial [Actinomycetota bacterium]|nr:helix-turn-helix domain-containing protein [Actinomycetota bacterium]